ncbi:hypothetical protein ACTXIM_16235 [Pseudoalteromonas nigrifaciens]|uniref:hypothetical protein n=1 Tax=Pseudoalteromonas nigrifaciens TaxID=28109 RepID=UPI003FD46DB6
MKIIKHKNKLNFIFSKVISAAGIVLLTYTITSLFDTKVSAIFFKDFIVLGFISILATFGLPTLVLIDNKVKFLKKNGVRESLYLFSFLCSVLFFISCYIVLGIFDFFSISILVLAFPIQSSCLFFAALLKSKGLINLGGVTEPGIISFISCISIITMGVSSIESVISIYLYCSILVVFFQLCILIGIKTFKVSKNIRYYRLVFILYRKSYHLFLSSIYVYLNTWAITLVISTNDKLLVLYNVAVRTASIFNFLINSLNNFFMIKSGGVDKKLALQLGLERISRQVKVQRVILYVFLFFMTLLFIFKSNLESSFKFDVLIFLMCIQSIVSYLFFGPIGALCISLGYLQYSHMINLTIFLLQVLVTFIYILVGVTDEKLLLFLIFICQFLIAFKDVVYKLCIEKIKKQLY